MVTYFVSFRLVLKLKDVIANEESTSVPIRSICIPGEPYVLAVSCDHNMLSVCYKGNGLSFMDINAVDSYLSNVSFFKAKIRLFLSNLAKKCLLTVFFFCRM